MLSSCKVFLVRHGKSEWNGRKIISGQLNPPLSEEGKRQADNLAKVLRHENLTAIHTSSLSRTVETALPTAQIHGLEVVQHDDLKEINFGILQGRYRDDRDPQAKKMWLDREEAKEHFRIPGAEVFEELKTRVDKCLLQILKKASTVLIVGHRSTNRMILSRLMNWPMSTAVGLKLRSKYLYEISFDRTASINTVQISNGSKIAGFID